MNRKDDQAGSHCPEPLTRPPLSADEISVLKCMALMEEEDRATFIRVAAANNRQKPGLLDVKIDTLPPRLVQRIAEATVKRRS
ncbi:hypothetical protein [Pseudomonas aeruginosa]|uniref:hypothetical protein n=1 Tax=Pseudomonas aeruginosa TaxID=287 RepID=UPI003AAEF89D